MPTWPVALVGWFEAHLRPMPWRSEPTPYRVWISEIMLQQTQVSTVTPYFERFMQRFPDLESLAAAPLSEVLRRWEGLGYYARARNLHRSARILTAGGMAEPLTQAQGARAVTSGLRDSRQVCPPDARLVAETQATALYRAQTPCRLPPAPGTLPCRAADWARLPGVGAYTAAAIASICFEEPVPVVDGNVARVFARFLALSDDIRAPAPRRRIAAFLAPVIAAVASPGRFNQAMMELGALVCRPRRPACDACPLAADCEARRQGRQDDLPVRPPRAALPTRHAVALYLVRRDCCLLLRHPDRRLLGGLWELPGGEFDPAREAPETALARWLGEQTGLICRNPVSRGSLTHGLTHFRLHLHLFSADAVGRLRPQEGIEARWTGPADLADSPMSRLHRRALEQVQASLNVTVHGGIRRGIAYA